MTTIKKYFAPVLVLSAALLLLSCGKDDNGNGGGNGGGEGGDPNPPVPTEKRPYGTATASISPSCSARCRKWTRCSTASTRPCSTATAILPRTRSRVRRREQPGRIRFPMHVQCRQPRYVDHERPNDGHVPVRRSRQVHRGRAGYFRIQPARLPVRFQPRFLKT